MYPGRPGPPPLGVIPGGGGAIMIVGGGGGGGLLSSPARCLPPLWARAIAFCFAVGARVSKSELVMMNLRIAGSLIISLNSASARVLGVDFASSSSCLVYWSMKVWPNLSMAASI